MLLKEFNSEVEIINLYAIQNKDEEDKGGDNLYSKLRKKWKTTEKGQRYMYAEMFEEESPVPSRKWVYQK